MGRLEFRKFGKDKYYVHNSKEVLLGLIIPKKEWKRFIFEPCHNTFYDSSCLREIVKFMEKVSNVY